MTTVGGAGGLTPDWGAADEAGAADRAQRTEGAGSAPPLAELPFLRGMRVDEIGPGKKKLAEPSGVVFHPGRGTLFCVGDRGHVVELSREGKVLQRERLGKLDLEGVTVGPGGRLYAVKEADKPSIIELDPDSLEVLRTFEVKRKLGGAKIIARKKNKGLEGIAWVPEHNAFYVLNQDKPPQIVKLSVPLDDPDGGKAKPVSAVGLEEFISDGAADLHWDPASGHFLVAETTGGGKGKLHEVSPDGEHLRSMPIPGDRPEGFTLDDTGTAFIAQDAGRLLRIRR
jgi:uncharacterized protein YjiK